MKTHYTIPIFIPEKACPYRCVYCNQYNITDRHEQPDKEYVRQTIDSYLKTFPLDGVKRVGFFGGSFTGMSIEEQNEYLDIVQPYVEDGRIKEIQLSTRPDYISEAILDNLKLKGVTIIELGAQSLDNRVLAIVGRGHTVRDVEESSKMINDYGFELGLQMMIGLPGDNYDTMMQTAHKIVALGAKNTRIYPTLVIKNTQLERMYEEGDYKPLTLEEAVCISKDLVVYFEGCGVKILRVGLHPSEGLINGTTLVAGPFHVSFKELVMTNIWADKIEQLVAGRSVDDEVVIEVPPGQINYAIGYGSVNRKMLERRFKGVKFVCHPISS